MIFHASQGQSRAEQARPRHAVRPQHFYVFVCGNGSLAAVDEAVCSAVRRAGCLFGNVLTLIHGRIFMLHSLRVAGRCHVAFIGPTAVLKCLLNKQISFVSTAGRGSRLVRRAACGVWRRACGRRRVACGMRHVACRGSQVALMEWLSHGLPVSPIGRVTYLIKSTLRPALKRPLRP